MASYSFLRCLMICVAVGGLVGATRLDSKSFKGASDERLKRLLGDLVEAKKRSAIKDDLTSAAKGGSIEAGVDKKSSDDSQVNAEKELADEEAKAEDTKNTPLGKAGETAAEGKNSGENGAAKVSENKDSDGDSGAVDGIFYFSGALADKIQKTCSIDIWAIYNGFIPVTLSAANDATSVLLSATEKLSSTLASPTDFAEDLRDFVSSSGYSDAKVSENVDAALKNIDDTLASVDKPVFCAVAQIVVNRLQMALYGGEGFANGYMCNKVYVEFARIGFNASKLLKAVKDDDEMIKTFTGFLADDMECYQKELEMYNKIVPTTPYTAQSPLQIAAFTSDFLIHYGVVLFYHHVVLQFEAEVIKACSSGDNNNENESDEDDSSKKELDKVDDEAEGLTNRLQALLKKLQEASEKKKLAESALNQRSSTGAKMPSMGEKTAIKKSHYRERAV